MPTLPSPLLSSSPKTLSAAAMLVPPAPSALSNSDLVIDPSPLLSMSLKRFCSACAGLADVESELVVPDWLCASSSALMVCGEMPVVPLLPEAKAVVGAGAAWLPAPSWKALVVPPCEDDAEDELDDVRACRLS